MELLSRKCESKFPYFPHCVSLFPFKKHYLSLFSAVLFLACLFQIIGRIFILVLFAYSFGPGKYYPLLVFLGSHIILMTILHFIFSDGKQYWKDGGFLNFSFFHYMLGNGLANIYIHNWIRMDPLLIKVS